jgi:anti-sigma-K factor RskA
MEDLYELYVLDLLDPESASFIQEHLDAQCDVCTARTREAAKLTSGLASLAPQVTPPPQVRSRILQAVQAPRITGSSWKYAFAAAVAASLMLFAWGVQLNNQSHSLSGEMTRLIQERNALRSVVEILSQSDMRTVQFGANQNAPHGRVFVSGSGGLIFVGSQLPQLAAGHAFELWLIPAKGNPQAAGVFRANAAGVSVKLSLPSSNVSTQPVNNAQITAVAVSVEPESGSPQPTTKPILIIPLA